MNFTEFFEQANPILSKRCNYEVKEKYELLQHNFFGTSFDSNTYLIHAELFGKVINELTKWARQLVWTC